MDEVLKLDGHGPLYEQIRRAIAGKIANRDWRPGERIPFESQLCQMFGTSRMTVSRAISSLVDNGMLVRRRRAGTFIAAQQSIHAPLTITAARQEVELSGCKYSWSITDRRTLTADAEDCPHQQFGVGHPLLRTKCLHFANDAPYMFETRWTSLERAGSIAGEEFTDQAPGEWLLRHVPWNQARHVIRAIGADPPIAGQLQIIPGSPCLQIERTTFFKTGPVTIAVLTYPGDRKELQGWFHPAI